MSSSRFHPKHSSNSSLSSSSSSSASSASSSSSSSTSSLLNQFLTLVILPIKRIIYDPLFNLVAWIFNIIVVVFISFLRTVFVRRTNVKVCLSSSSGTTADSSKATLTNNNYKHSEVTTCNKNNKRPSLSPYFSALMVPSALSYTNERKSLVLDLDETLVHSQFKYTDHCDLKLDVRINSGNNNYNGNYPTIFYVSKRPYLDVFLRTVAQWYDIVIFTASLQKYGDPLITILDVDHVVKRRMFRQDCIRRNGNFVKDLTTVNPNLSHVIIIDNSPAAYSIQPSNAIPIQTWYHDQNDEELLNLLPLLHALAFLNDVRSILDLRLTGGALVGREKSQSHATSSMQ